MKLKGLIIFLSLLSFAACSNAGNESSGTSTEISGSSTETSTSSTDQASTVLAPGDYNKTITVGSDLRSYIVHVPENYDGTKALPLVFIFHGGGGSAKGMMKSTGMNQKADEKGFFVAYLQGTVGPNGKASWNSGLMPGLTPTIDDVGFVRGVVSELEGQLNVDSRRIFAAGFSAGSGLTYRLAGEIPDVLAGVAVIESTIGNSIDGGDNFSMIPDPQGPFPVLMINGKADPIVIYDGGQGGNPDMYTKSVADAVAFWTLADSCSTTPQTQTSTDGNVITDDYTACASGSEVELITTLSGQHEWPTLNNHAHFPATDAIWDFFSRHSKSN